jgi:hypothetical protein
MKNAAISLMLAAGLGMTPACTSDFDAKPDQSDKKGGKGGKEDAYNPYNDNPATFANDLEHRLAELPRSGAATVAPWAGNYWPTYQDNINYRWDGPSSESPAAKYGRAFGIANLEDIVSRNYGVDRYKGQRTACTSTSDCDSSIGESCAKRTGATEGVCIPTWWGICHAWAPLALSVPEPKYPVTYNGVEFKVNDIKALLTLTWNRVNSKFVSTRCNKNENDLTHDAYGNYRNDPECEDTNPGTWHIIATNYLGVRGESFVYDRTYDDQVWNQPLRDFEITRQDLITARRANELTGVKAEGGTTVNASGTVVAGEFYHHAPVAVTAGNTFNVQMTGTGDADLHVRFGSQPTASAYDCRPYDNGSDETCSLQVPAGATQAFVSVRGYADSSDFELEVTTGGSVPDTYVHNTNAAELYLVNMKVGFIAESAASTDGNLAHDIDRYTHYDHYEYVLEVDSAGRIVGGVWINGSINTHPDFLWLPTGPRDATVANGTISRAQVMTLVELSLQEPGTGGGDTGPVTVTEGGTVAKDAWVHYGPFESADGIRVTMTGTSDADLYVRKNAAPTRTAYDCRPYRSGSSESCALTGAGTFYVSVNGWATSSDFDLTIEYTTGQGENPPPIDPVDTVEHFTETGSVSQGEMKYYTLEVNAGHRVFIRTFAQKDVDLYIQMNAQPTTSAYLERAWTTSGNEVIEYTPTQNGTLHIGVHGYQASDFTLRTADL